MVFSMVRPWLLRFGTLLYAISFGLPAIGYRRTPSDPGDPVYGFLCAWLALAGNFRSFSLPLFASGRVNGFALAWLALRIAGVYPGARRGFALAAVCSIPFSWYVIGQGMTVKVGHVAWVAGLLLMLLPEAIGALKKPGVTGTPGKEHS
jgi:hypothetical protein